MASTNFTDNQTVIYAAWLNDVNNAVYNGIFVSPSITATSVICNGTASGAGFTNLINNTFTAPGPIGSVTPSTGRFTTLQATGAFTGTTISATAISGTTGTFSGTVQTPTLSDGTNSTSSTNAIKGSARAWLNYNGATQTVRDSYNISSVTRNGVGDYTANFTTAMPNANYVLAGTQNSTTQNMNPTPTSLLTTSVTFYTSGGAGAGTGVAFYNYDPTLVLIAIFSA
jgi:hypothetical protein